MRAKWNTKEIVLLTDNWKYSKKEELLSLLSNRTWSSIRNRARILRLTRYQTNKRIGSLINLLDETPITYYWLGLLMSDGHFGKCGRLVLTLHIKDRKLLEKFAEFIGGKVTTYKEESCSVGCGDRENFDKLIDKFSISSRKTYEPCNLQNIKGENLLSFLIGFIDGDGNISKTRGKNLIRIRCHSSWVQNFQYIIDNLELGNKITPAHICKENYSNLIIYNFETMKILKREAIRLGLPFLERKWDKIDLNLISRNEKTPIYRNMIENLLKTTNLTCTEISKIIKLNVSSVRTYKRAYLTKAKASNNEN